MPNTVYLTTTLSNGIIFIYFPLNYAMTDTYASIYKLIEEFNLLIVGLL